MSLPYDPIEHTLRQLEGSARIADAVLKVEFPATRAELVRRLHGATLEVADERLPVAELARGLPEVRFEDAQAAQRALDARWSRILGSVAQVERAERAEREE